MRERVFPHFGQVFPERVIAIRFAAAAALKRAENLNLNFLACENRRRKPQNWE